MNDARQLLIAGDAEGAVQKCAALIAQGPDHPEALHLRSLAQTVLGRPQAALEDLTRAVALEPSRSSWWRDLATTAALAGQWHISSRAYRRWQYSAPPDPHWQMHYAALLLASGRARQALPVALAVASIATGINQDDALAHALAAKALEAVHRFPQALKFRRKAVELDPDNSAFWTLYAIALHRTGQFTASHAAYSQALALKPDACSAHSLQLMNLLYDPAQTGESIAAQCRAWASAHAGTSEQTAPHSNSPDPDRVLRVGYLCGEFLNTQSRHFVMPLIEHHDRGQFEIFLYHSAATEDVLTLRYRELNFHWRNVSGLSDDEVVSLVRKDSIDILVEMSGHFAGARLKVFSRRPAPVQVAIPNFPSTTGLTQIDYILTDRSNSPAGTEREYTETPVFLKTWYMPYRPPPDAPPIAPLPGIKNGYITFGLMHRLTKLNDAVLDAAAAVLLATPDSRILVHSAWPNLHRRRDAVCVQLLRRFAQRGIAEERVLLCGGLAHGRHLDLIGTVDIALDAFPFNGTTTTCECVWMGVPVATVRGCSHVSRVGASLLSHLGMNNWIAENVDEYIRIAVRAALDRQKLSTLRQSLRTIMSNCSLTRPGAVTREMESAYRIAWQAWTVRTWTVKNGQRDQF